MPTLYYAKDGRRPHTQRGPGIRVSFEELRSAFPNAIPQFVSSDAPEFNVDKPSQYPVRVVVEVEADEGTAPEYPKIGFYLLPDLSPEQAQQQLDGSRGK